MDYVHKRKFPALGPLLMWTLRATTVAVGVGVYQFNTNDIGGSETRTRIRPSFTTDVCFASPRFDGAHPPRLDCIGGFSPLLMNAACTRTKQSNFYCPSRSLKNEEKYNFIFTYNNMLCLAHIWILRITSLGA